MLFRFKKMKKTFLVAILLLTIISLSLLFSLTKARASENFNYNIDVNYLVRNDGNTLVKETYNITNNSETQYLDNIRVSTPSANINSIQVYYANGGSIPYETAKITRESGGFSYDYTEIKVNFNRANVGQGLNWSFVIQYSTSDIVENKGRANVVYIPGVSAENRDEYNVTLTVPNDYGQVHGFGKLPKLTSQTASTKTFSFSKDDLFNNSVQLLFGDSTTYKANFIYPLLNDTNSAKDFEIALPPSTESQSSFLEKIDPAPISTRVDGDGNVIAKYKLEANQKLDIKADVLADVRYIQYDFSKSGEIKDIPQPIRTNYTKASKYWPADNNQIKQKANELTADKPLVIDKVKSINDYVLKTLNYNNEKIKYNIRQGGLEALNNPNNVVCLEYSDLTISLLRAAGIPARMPVGYAYSGDLKKSKSVSDSLHSWVQVYIPANGWINLDPTWGEKFNNFGISDIDHFAFAIWGENDSEPVAVTKAGLVTNYQYENVQLSYTTEIPKVSDDAKINATNWAILPFISITSYQVNSPSNATIFDAKVEFISSTEKTVLTKTLAPSEIFKGTAWNLGISFASFNKIELIDPISSGALASSNVTNNYLPMIVSLVLIVSVILILTVVKLRNNNSKKKKDTTNDSKEK